MWPLRACPVPAVKGEGDVGVLRWPLRACPVSVMRGDRGVEVLKCSGEGVPRVCDEGRYRCGSAEMSR